MDQHQIIEKLIRDIQLRGFSKDTEKDYSAIIRRFQEYFQKPANELGEPEIRKYLLYLAVEKKLSPSSVNSCNSALRFLYEVTLEKNLNYRRIPRMKDPIILPTVLNKDEVQAIFDVTDNLKHKCILTTIYGSGLRLSEATTLKVSDIDSKNMRIFIEQAKGKKDRYVLLSQTNLNLLREYWKAIQTQTLVIRRNGKRFPYNEKRDPRYVQKILTKNTYYQKGDSPYAKTQFCNTFTGKWCKHLLHTSIAGALDNLDYHPVLARGNN